MKERTMKNENVLHRKIMPRDQCRVLIANGKGSWRAVGGKQNRDNWSQVQNEMTKSVRKPAAGSCLNQIMSSVDSVVSHAMACNYLFYCSHSLWCIVCVYVAPPYSFICNLCARGIFRLQRAHNFATSFSCFSFFKFILIKL